MKKGTNKYHLTPVTYETYRKLRAFKYEVVGYNDRIRLNKPTCYKDKNRAKFCMWYGNQKIWVDYAQSLGLKENVHYVHSQSSSCHGPYETIILYIEEVI